MGREIAVSRIAESEGHSNWLENNAVDYGSDPLDLLIRQEDRGEIIPLLGPRGWPYPGQDRTPYEENPSKPSTPDFYVGPCENCHGNRNPRRHCLVCNPATPGVKRLPPEASKKYVPKGDGMRGGIGA